MAVAELTGVPKEIYEFGSKEGDAIPVLAIIERFSHVDKNAIVEHLNMMVRMGLFEMFSSARGIHYRAISGDEGRLAAALEGDERTVYHCIKQADNRGIWTKDLKVKTNLHQTIITKVLRVLESKRLIKAVKSVKNSTRKVYMLAHMEPSVEITGGPWFSENELDVSFIDDLCNICHRYILSRSMPRDAQQLLSPHHRTYPDLRSIYSFVIESKIVRMELSMDNLQSIVDRLVYDGLVARMVAGSPAEAALSDDSDGEDGRDFVYRALPQTPATSAMGEVPCGMCPVRSECADSGPITPAKCEYYTAWLAF